MSTNTTSIRNNIANKYLFILGRNTELSIAELISYFEMRGNKIISFSLRNNALVLELEKEIGKIINELGGVIAIGEMLCEGSLKELARKIEKIELYNEESNKLVYAFWNFSDEEAYIEFKDYLRLRFKKEKLKATEKTFRGDLKIQGKETVKNIPSQNKIDIQFFLFKDEASEEYSFGKIIETYNSKELEKRDMGKPVRREELAISPRLAKIMLNLSQVKKGETFLDPFCGIGVILQEALLQDIKVIGIDKDPEAIDGARKNLKFSGFQRNNYQLFNEDSRKMSFYGASGLRIQSIATEPNLGEILKKIPSEIQGENMAIDFENLIISVINNLKPFISGRIVFTSPLIKTNRSKIGVSKERILKATGLKLVDLNKYEKDISVDNPIQEIKDEKIVNREIFVLEK